MPDDPTEDLRQRLVNELADAPQGTRDSEMPPSPNPFGGEVGPDPADDTLPVVDLSDETRPPETGEETDPGTAFAGGVSARNTDGSTRTGAQ